jgi:hypothetical protein
MDGILDNLLTDDDFKAAGESGQGAAGTDPVAEAFDYPKMKAELGLEETK